MKEYTNKDGLEDFLRNSFDEYEQSPSDQVWDQIEQDLVREPKGMYLFSSIWLRAAAVLVVVLGLGHYFLYQHLVGALTQEINQNAIEIQRLEQRIDQDQIRIDQFPVPLKDTTINEEYDGEKNKFDRPVARLERKESGWPLLPIPTLGIPNPPGSLQAEKARVSSESITGSVAGPERLTRLAGVSERKQQHSDSRITPFSPLLSNVRLLPLRNRQPSVKSFLEDSDTRRGALAFRLGVHYSPYFTVAKLSSPAARQPIPPTAGGGTNDALTKITGFSYSAGLSASLDIGNHWFLETGVNYRSFNLSSDLQLRFEFAQFQPGGGTNDPQFALQYPVSTPAGDVAIELVAIQSDPAEVIEDEEIINLNLKTTHVEQQLSIPLLVGYRFGKSPVTFELKGGILANYLLDTDFLIDGVEFTDNQLREDFPNRRNRPQPELKALTFDYLVGGGVNYRITPSWEVSLSPVFIGSITNPPEHASFRVRELSAGVDFGLNLIF